ncbi:prepilin peptidase [Castellaniella sp. UC4442_H9]
MITGTLAAAIAAVAFVACAVTLLPAIARRVAQGMRRTLAADLIQYKACDIGALIAKPATEPFRLPVRAVLAVIGSVAVFITVQDLGLVSMPYVAYATILFLLTCVDQETHLLPPSGVDGLLALGVVSASLGQLQISAIDAVLGAVGGWALWWVPLKIGQIMSRKPSMLLGDGDLRLLAACGAWLAWPSIVAASVWALVAGLAYYGLIAAIDRRTDRHPTCIAFAPPITLASYLALIAQHI